MITLPERSELRDALAEIIADVCRCDKQALLQDVPFEALIEHYDSLTMLEILLGIEARYDISTDDMLPPEVRTQEEMTDVFPKNLSDLASHVYVVADRLHQAEQENATAGDLNGAVLENSLAQAHTAEIERCAENTEAHDENALSLETGIQTTGTYPEVPKTSEMHVADTKTANQKKTAGTPKPSFHKNN